MSHANDIHDMYPSPRQALFGNGHVANLWCGLKYTAWKALYLTLSVGILVYLLARWTYWGFLEPVLQQTWSLVLQPIGHRVNAILQQYAVGVTIATFLRYVYRILVQVVKGVVSFVKTSVQWVGKFLTAVIHVLSDTPVATVSWYVSAIFLLPLFIVLMSFDEINARTGIFTGIWNVIVFSILAVVGFFVGSGKQVGSCSKSAAGRLSGGLKDAAEEMQDRPGTRRIYGVCPVSFDQHPKWFDDLFGDLFEDDEDPTAHHIYRVNASDE